MYRIRKEISTQLKNKYIVEKLEFSNVWVSQLLNGKRVIPKHSAYAIAKLYDKEIEELFERIED